MPDAKDSKAKKPTKTIVDVKKEGDASAGTSKQVLVSNRPVVKDPMMAEVSELAGVVDTTPPVDPSDKPSGGTVAAEETQAVKSPKKVMVKHDDDAAPAPATETPASTEEPAAEEQAPVLKKKITIKPLSDEEKSAAGVPESTEAPQPTKSEPKTATAKAKPTQDTPPVDSNLAAAAAADASQQAATAAKEAKQPTAPAKAGSTSAEAPVAPQAEPTTADTQAEASAEATDTPSADEEVVTGVGVQPGRSFDEDDEKAADQAASRPADDAPAEASDGPEPDSPETTAVDENGKPKRQTQKSGQLTSEQKKAIETGQYFLPITTTETRRLRREIAIAAVVVILLIAVWLNIMLDAGIISIGGIEPLTDFF